jgi:hypothetical protein
MNIWFLRHIYGCARISLREMKVQNRRCREKVINEVKPRCGEREISEHQSMKIRNGTVLV